MNSPEPCIARLPAGARIVPGNAGDHPMIQQLLTETLQVHVEEDFQSRIDDPAYRPSDRLLVRMDESITAHVHVSDHVGMFDGERVPLVWLENFTVLPEHAGQHDAALLEASESIALQEGAVVALTVTRRPGWFEERGWTKLISQGHTRADVRATLAHFDALEATQRRRLRPDRIVVRAWRHLELDCLREIYEAAIDRSWGPLSRSDRSWQWLIGRKAHDQILIAAEALESSDESAAREQPVGYAVIRDSCVIEMFTLPGYTAARMKLLARACRDAIDRDHHFVSLHTSADDPLHEVMVTAGGAWVGDGANGSERWMVKLLAPDRWIERLFPVLHRRARELSIERPVCAVFNVEEATYELTQTRRSARLKRDENRSTDGVVCRWPQFQNLLLGNYASPLVGSDAADRCEQPPAEVAALFPPKLLWQSPFELIRL